MQTPAPPAQMPDLLILDRDFGFSVNGLLRVWPADKAITDRSDIAELLAHDAPARCYQEIADE